MSGALARMEGAEMAKKHLKKCLVKLTVTTSFSNYPADIITQPLLRPKEWWSLGAEESLVSSGKETQIITPFQLQFRHLLSYK